MERQAYRIIDANFNRAREAIRVIEEYCRFALENSELTSTSKQIRHELCSAITSVDSSLLIGCRNTREDVGVGKTVIGQLRRAELKDTFTAACKRLTEALRAIAETAQPLSPQLTETAENLRYRAYTLEKDIVIFSDTNWRFKNVCLYVLITATEAERVNFLTDSCIAGGADCIQLRAKNIETNKFFSLAATFSEKCRNAGVISIINDRPDIAIAAKADGVHLGQHDLPVEHVRSLQTYPLIIGKSTHSLDQLSTAIDEHPTYVGLGPVFVTATKPGISPVGCEYVSQAVNKLTSTGIAHVAIGGITEDNVGSVLNSGAKAIAVCSAVTDASDPTNACRALKQKICCPDGNRKTAD